MLKQFEQELAAFHGMTHAIGTGNGTDAIWLALMAMGIGPGDEVITHPNTFFATAEAIWIAGATAVFVDCDPKHEVHRPRQDRGGDHAARRRPSFPCTSTVSAPMCEQSGKSPTHTTCVIRTTRRLSTPPAMVSRSAS